MGGILGFAGNGFPVGTGTIEITGTGSALTFKRSTVTFLSEPATVGLEPSPSATAGRCTQRTGRSATKRTVRGTLNISGPGTTGTHGDDGTGTGAILRVGGSGDGTLNVSNGAVLSITPTSGVGFGGLVAGGNSSQTGGVGTINVDGGKILINGDTATRFSLGGGTGGTANLNIINGGQVIVAPSSGLGGEDALCRSDPTGNAFISGPGSLLDAGNFLGIGIAADQVSNSGVGTVMLSAGGAISAAAIRIGTQGSLFGIGTISGNLTDAGGQINPGLGNVFGQLSLNGLSLQGTLDFTVGGLAAGSRDFFQVNGSANLSGGRIQVDFTNGYKPNAGDVIHLLLGERRASDWHVPTISFNQTPSLPTRLLTET